MAGFDPTYQLALLSSIECVIQFTVLSSKRTGTSAQTHYARHAAVIARPLAQQTIKDAAHNWAQYRAATAATHPCATGHSASMPLGAGGA